MTAHDVSKDSLFAWKRVIEALNNRRQVDNRISVQQQTYEDRSFMHTLILPLHSVLFGHQIVATSFRRRVAAAAYLVLDKLSSCISASVSAAVIVAFEY
jgi:hypothetical protein